MSAVPLIRQPFGLPPSPQGKAKGAQNGLINQAHVSGSGARGTAGRTDAPVLFPLASGSRHSTKKGNCEQVSTKRLFFGGLGPQR